MASSARSVDRLTISFQINVFSVIIIYYISYFIALERVSFPHVLLFLVTCRQVILIVMTTTQLLKLLGLFWDEMMTGGVLISL